MGLNRYLYRKMRKQTRKIKRRGEIIGELNTANFRQGERMLTIEKKLAVTVEALYDILHGPCAGAVKSERDHIEVLESTAREALEEIGELTKGGK